MKGIYHLSDELLERVFRYLSIAEGLSKENVAFPVFSVGRVSKKFHELSRKSLSKRNIGHSYHWDVYFKLCVGNVPEKFMVKLIRQYPDCLTSVNSIVYFITQKGSKYVTLLSEIFNDPNYQPQEWLCNVFFTLCIQNNNASPLHILFSSPSKKRFVDMMSEKVIYDALITTIDFSHVDILRDFIIKHFYPKKLDLSAKKNFAIRRACEIGNIEIVNFLYTMITSNDDTDGFGGIHDRILSAGLNSVPKHKETLLSSLQKSMKNIFDGNNSVTPNSTISTFSFHWENDAISVALRGKHREVIEFLLQKISWINIGSEDWYKTVRIIYRETFQHISKQELNDLENVFHRHMIIVMTREELMRGSNCLLRWAAWEGRVEMIRKLIEKGKIDPTVPQNAALQLAVMRGDDDSIEVVRLLLRDERVIFDSVGMNICTHIISSGKHAELIRQCLMKKKRFVENFESEKSKLGDLKSKVKRELRNFSGMKNINHLHQMIKNVCDGVKKAFKASSVVTTSSPSQMPSLIREAVLPTRVRKELEEALQTVTRSMKVLEEERIRGFWSGRKIFVGQLNEKMEPHGFGEIYLEKSGKMTSRIYSLVRIFKGYFKNGKRNGKGREFSPEGGNNNNNQLIFEGAYENDLRHGRGTLYKRPDDEKSCTMDGEWVKGKLYKLELEYDFDLIPYDKLQKYCVRENQLGKGSHGQVYRVPPNVLPSSKYKGKATAVKIFNFGGGDEFSVRGEYVKDLLRRSLSLCSKFEHPNLCKVYGMVSGASEVGYLMELCADSVESLIKQSSLSSTNSHQKLKMSEKLRILYETSRGMAYLHSKQVMHRDLKWGNVMVHQIEREVKICDFDSAKEDESTWRFSVTNTKTVGTPIFLAPEIYGGKTYGCKVDIFSFGIMIHSLIFEMTNPFSDLYQCSCGEVISNINCYMFPFHVSKCNLRPRIDPSKINNQDIKWLIDLMILCWDKEAHKRPSFTEITNILESQIKKTNTSFIINIKRLIFKNNSNSNQKIRKCLILKKTFDEVSKSVQKVYSKSGKEIEIEKILVEFGGVGNHVHIFSDDQVERFIRTGSLLLVQFREIMVPLKRSISNLNDSASKDDEKEEEEDEGEEPEEELEKEEDDYEKKLREKEKEWERMKINYEKRILRYKKAVRKLRNDNEEISKRLKKVLRREKERKKVRNYNIVVGSGGFSGTGGNTIDDDEKELKSL